MSIVQKKIEIILKLFQLKLVIIFLQNFLYKEFNKAIDAEDYYISK